MERNSSSPKEKWQITIDFLMIIGKYFNSCQDFINVMKVCSKYIELVEMYKFNPISNSDLFINIETQHFYEYKDIFYRKRGMIKYIYWIKPFVLNDYFKLIDTTLCEVKDISLNKIYSFCNQMNFQIGKIIQSDLIYNLNRIKKGYLIIQYNNNYFGLIINREKNNDYNPKYYDCKYFINEQIFKRINKLSPSTLHPLTVIYLQNTNSGLILTITLKSDNYITIQLEEDSNDFKKYLSEIMFITDYYLIEN